MKARKILTALGLALALNSSMPVYAYSTEKLDELEENYEEYINEKIEMESNNCSNDSEDDLTESYNRYVRIQKLIKYFPTEYYYELVDSIKISPVIKDILKSCIDDTMKDAARESLIYANIAENDQEILNNIMIFFESRDNGNSFDRSAGMSKDTFNLEDISVFDNREDIIALPKSPIIFKDYSSYGNYRIYHFYDTSSYYGNFYYLVTDNENKIIALIKNEDKENSYTYLGDEEIYINTLEEFLTASNLTSLIKDDYTYDELVDLKSKFAQKNKINKRKIFELEGFLN